VSKRYAYFGALLAGVLLVLLTLGAQALNDLKAVDDDSLTREDTVELVEEGPKVALEKLKEEALEDPYVSKRCHHMLHGMGRATYRKYQDLDKSWSFADTYCSGGYLHGNLLEYFGERQTFPENFDACSQFEYQSEYQWQCNHGAGNGFVVFTDNDIEEALNFCKSEFDSSFEEKACANGAYVQYFRDVSLGDSSNYTYPEDAFDLCSETKSEFKEECYKYVSYPYHMEDVSNIVEMSQKCMNIDDSNLESTCLERLFEPYFYKTVFEVSRYTAGVNIISSLETPSSG